MKLSRRIFSALLALVLLLGALPLQASARGPMVEGIGFVTKAVKLRAKASNTSKILDSAPKDEVVVILGQTGNWYQVIYNLQKGYMHKNYLSVKAKRNAELGYGVLNGTDVNLRSGAGTSYKSLGIVNTGDKAYIIGLNNGWYKVICQDQIGYIRSDFVDLTEIPYENQDSKNKPLFFIGGNSTGVTPSAKALKAAQEDDPAADSSADNGLVDGIGFVTRKTLKLRKGPSTKTAALATAYKGEVVVILEKVGNWYRVLFNLQEGYMLGTYLRIENPGHAELGYGKITGNGVNLRSGASTSKQVLAVGYKGSLAYVIGVRNGWYRVIFQDQICFIRSDYLALTQVPYENRASSNDPIFYKNGKSTGVTPSADALWGEDSSGVTGAQIVSVAKQYLGTPYAWGGTTPAGFDCSGFVYFVMRSVGISCPRMIEDMNQFGRAISKKNLKPGDVVIFQNTYKSGLSHVGIYVGDGKFIHSPNSGDVVSYDDLNSDYYTQHYYGARRMTG